MSVFNPYAVEEVLFENSAVSVFAGQGRYYGGVSGLGRVIPRGVMIPEEENRVIPRRVLSRGLMGLGGERSPSKLRESDDLWYSSPPLIDSSSGEIFSQPGEWLSWDQASGSDGLEVKTASLPGWAPVAIGLGVLGIGGFFVWKAIKRR